MPRVFNCLTLSMLFTICWIMFFYVKETSIIDLSVINRDSENKGRETIPMEIFSLPNSKYSFRDCPLYQCKYKTLNNTLFLNYGELSQVNIKNIPFCSDILFNRLLIFDGFSRQFSIPYYISFGTLLGSFLMQDIFPWTQDLDVVIPDHSLLALLGNEVIVEHLKRTGLIIFRFRQTIWIRYDLCFPFFSRESSHNSWKRYCLLLFLFTIFCSDSIKFCCDARHTQYDCCILNIIYFFFRVSYGSRFYLHFILC
jgi:hypothetical protein